MRLLLDESIPVASATNFPAIRSVPFQKWVGQGLRMAPSLPLPRRKSLTFSTLFISSISRDAELLPAS